MLNLKSCEVTLIKIVVHKTYETKHKGTKQ